MKKALLLLVICFSSGILLAQDKKDIGKLPLAVIMRNDPPEDLPKMYPQLFETLKIKVIQIVTASGMASDGLTPTFAIFPTFTISESKVADGGMQNIHVVKAEFTLYIKEINNGLVLSSMIKKLTGSGSSEYEAAKNAIDNISASDKEYQSFIGYAKDKIVAYYDTHCEEMIASADNSVAKKDYEEALATLMSIPIEAKSCYETAQKKSVTVYKQYEAKECAGLILNAKAYIAARQYADALNVLGWIDPTSPCSKEAEDLIKSTGKKVDAEEKKFWDAALKIYSDQVALENHRIDAMEEIAISHYKKSNHNKSKSQHKK